MGRPADQFCKDNVEELEPKGRWRCKHCKLEFSGSASRIRNHLSGQGTDIGSCEKVPSHVREEALKRASKKRGRNSSSREGNDGISAVHNRLDMVTALQVPSLNIGNLSTNKGSEQECTIDVIVKFFVSRNIPLDAVKDPHFTILLRRAAQHGFPSCLLRDDSIGVQKSVSNLEYEVNEYMAMVKESWKTTGCTLITYNLNGGTGNLSAVETDSVYGFYCPKGFIFVEGRQLDFANGVEHALKKHVLNLPVDDVTHYIYHFQHPMCELAHEPCPNHIHNFDCDIFVGCAQQQVQRLWRGMCAETGWIQNLIQKSDKLYEFILNSEFCKDLKKEMVEKDADHMLTSLFTHLGSIMHFEGKIKKRLSKRRLWHPGVEEIINNKEFWSDGKDLLKVVTPLMGIIDPVDTLVPIGDYLRVAMDKAKHTLEPYYEREVSKYQVIKGYLDNFKIGWKDDAAATYLSPINHCSWRAEEGDIEPTRIELQKLVRREEEKEQLVAELKDYKLNNPFAKLSTSECRNYHPVTLWNEYGGEFPVLRKCAIKLLSQPGSCMCNQVKKHILHCQGTDNFILRLNYQMMQEFIKLGDRIYEPLRSQFFEDGKSSGGDHGSSSKTKHTIDDFGNLSSLQGPTMALNDRFFELDNSLQESPSDNDPMDWFFELLIKSIRIQWIK